MTSVRPMLACGLPGDTQAEKLAALDRLPYPLLASYKLDGIRCLITEDGPQTRSGEPIPNDYVRGLLEKLPVGLDGELVCEVNGVADFRLTTGNIRRKLGEPSFKYYVFDLYKLTDEPLRMRYPFLLGMAILDLPDWAVVLKQGRVESAHAVKELYAEALSAGHEGLILRNPSGLYKHGRATFKSADMLKVKPYEDAEAVIVGVFERMHNTSTATKDKLGHTKRSNLKSEKASTGMLGGFVVLSPKDYADMDDVHWAVRAAYVKVHGFEVARGKMTHAEATCLWTDRDKLVGKIIRYQHVTVGGYDVPRHGTFQGFREAWDMDKVSG